MELEPIIGRYASVDLEGQRARVYFEEAGAGPILLCLHTAGADSRQYRYILNDPEITARWRVVAFDLPYHGRSSPLGSWWRERYRLTADRYERTILAVIDALELERPVVMGCSMGGAIVLRLAARHGERFSGIIGLESTARAGGRYLEYLDHPAVNGGELVATYTYGLCAPQSPEHNRRENWWYYAQSAPGVYQGDVYFYSQEWDERQAVAGIDTARCPVVLLTGEYDYSCTPEMTRETAARIPGAEVTIMPGIGHFPMIEHPERFRPHVLAALERMRKDVA
ncbi:MAG: alpha/beta hydrolase [bacterium]|nr:alpha/beta hydrolase [bacterium]